MVFPGGMGSLAGSSPAAVRGHPGAGCWLLVSPCRDVKTGTVPARGGQGGQINDAGSLLGLGITVLRAGKYPECRKRLSQRDRGDGEGPCWGQPRLFWAAGRGRGEAGWWDGAGQERPPSWGQGKAVLEGHRGLVETTLGGRGWLAMAALTDRGDRGSCPGRVRGHPWRPFWMDGGGW